MGARGNSGVITSQIFRGMAEGLGGKSRFNGLDLAHALSQGAKTAYGAVAKPVEGTILTVIRESADAAVMAAERDNDIETVLTATLAAAEKSVARTPSLLAILREAGVVDSGGQGLYRLFQGALLHLVGQAPAGAARERSHAGAGVKPSTLVAHADEGFGYETMFLLQPNGSGGLDVDAIRDHLESIGESVLVAGDSRALKVHVHNERPDLVIGLRAERRRRSAGSASRTSTTRRATSARRAPRPSPARRRRPLRPRAGPTRVPFPSRRRRSASSRSSPATAWRRSSATSGSQRSSRAASPPTRAPASCSRRSAPSTPARSSSCPTTRTSSWPRARSRRWPIGRSSSSRPATPPRASPRCSRSTRASTPRPTPAR